MQQKSELPEGWIETPLERILSSLESGSRPKGGVQGISEGIPSIGGEHLNENGGFRFDKIKFVAEEFFGKMNQGIIKVNDILIVKDGATTGKVAIVKTDFPYDRAAVNEHVFLCRPYSELRSDYIFYFLFSEIGQKRILNNFRGSAQGGINKSFAPNTIIPLPPLLEQHRIVSAIEALFARLDATNEKLDRVPEILKKFRESVLAAACDGRLTEDWRRENLYNVNYSISSEDSLNLIKQWKIPMTWLWTTLNDSCAHIVDCPHSTPKWTDDGVYCIRTSELKPGYIDLRNARFVSEKTYLERIKRLEPQEGDILYSREGTVGIASLVPSNVKICLGQRLMLFRTKNIIPSFFVKILNSPYIYDYVQKSTMGSTAPRINVANIKKFPIPLPSLSEQQEIVRRVDALFAFANSIEAKVTAAREKTEKLRQSILAKAFSGQLVETEAEIARREGREYETAEVLLERIKEERRKDRKKG